MDRVRARDMKALALLVLTGCLGGQLDANLRPAVQPKLSELPGESEKRDTILNQANTTPGPETPRKQLSGNWRKIETGAAFIAAFLGAAASKTKNVTLGFALTLDPEADTPRPTPPPVEPVDSTKLVPWVPLPSAR